jgi:hypothetical protein
VGDAASGPIPLSFNPHLRVEFRRASVTSDTGLLLSRELAERLGQRPVSASFNVLMVVVAIIAIALTAPRG